MSKLNTKQEEFATALYNALQNNQALNESDWKEVVTDVETAYLVQQEVAAKKAEPTGGYKVSLTSEQTQKLFDSDCPLFGRQVGSRFYSSPCNLELKDFNEPLVEVEMVFTALEDLSPEDSLEDLLAKTAVSAGLEVPDARFKDWFPSLGKCMVVSDCAVGGCVAYGKEHKTSDLFPTVESLATVKAQLFHNGELVAEGSSDSVLGNPLNSLKWLVSKLAENGETFKKGQRVSSGTFVFPPKLLAGEWKVTYDSGLGDCLVNVK